MNIEVVSGSEIRGLSVSIVVYRPDLERLTGTLGTLAAACKMLRTIRQELPVEVCLVDNGGLPDFGASLDALRAYNIVCTTLTGHGNIGYGRGHNLAIEKSCSRYHLVLNPDIDIDPDALIEAFAFLDAHADVALLTPRIDDQQRRMQYLCRRYPTMVDLFVRGFFPENLRRLFARRLASYEMQDVVNDRDIVWDPPIVSGCFMLFRTRVLKQLGGFDPRYFLYFEDYDLSLRTNEIARVAYVPSVHVVHHGGGASRKGFAHIRMFGASAFKFFNRFGWRLW
ncbi:glycosyltransferase family 2 protein [Burkholderia multivorans]|uniref:glycosyltransferase family 2 protein n=1 Tax=Burkholderia ubonensis TaxID=101571 RepID=UPI000F6EF993|nr:glycosyltransferase family 2 protein [Burkholderia ubonensis]AYZ68382.1 glycosyltransferase family 2 protein [Burkholderia multivorans]